MSKRDDIAKALMMQETYAVPSPWPMPPGEAPLQMIPPASLDLIERPPVNENPDANAVRPDDVLQQYFDREQSQEDI
jgi:hypothetical protein